MKLLIGAVIILFSLFKYWSRSETNEFTGKKQHISLSPDQEIQLGLQSAPGMAQKYGGLYPDQEAQNLVKKVGQKLVNGSKASRSLYRFNYYLLQDPETINAFALPGGQVFVTYGLFKYLKTEDQLAGVLGHETGHVIGRHSAEQMAKQELTQGILTGFMTGTDPSSAQVAAMVANFINMKYGRDDELEADNLGVRIMIEAGYDPMAMIGVMKILEQTAGEGPPEFQSTHPSPPHRIEEIKKAIEQYKTESI